MTVRADPGADRARFLAGLGAEVRSRRAAAGLTLRELSSLAGVSSRFLVQVEGGEGNISIARLLDVARALGTSPAELLGAAEAHRGPLREGIVALVGLRGAGKTTIGSRLAARLGVPFVELDVLVARRAGMGLSTIFEIHGEAYFRRVEREALSDFLAEHRRAVLATGGSLVTDPETYGLLRSRALTVWLKARAEDHWDRVVAQGDGRPMKGRKNAMNELETLLRARSPLYAAADRVLDTSRLSVDEAVEDLLAAS